MVMMLVVVSVTTADHVVDHKWSIGVPELSSYTWLSKGVIFKENTSVVVLMVVLVTTPD